MRSLHLKCTGPFSYKGGSHVQRDIENLKAALQGTSVAEAFIPAISPTSIENWQVNRYYKTQEEYLYAIAKVMRAEYR